MNELKPMNQVINISTTAIDKLTRLLDSDLLTSDEILAIDSMQAKISLAITDLMEMHYKNADLSEIKKIEDYLIYAAESILSIEVNVVS